MSDYWREIRRFLIRERIGFDVEKGYYDNFYRRYHYYVTIHDDSLDKFKEFKDMDYFLAKKLVTFRWKDGEEFIYY